MQPIACGLMVGSQNIALALIEVQTCSEQLKPFASVEEMVSKRYSSFEFVHWVMGVKLDLERTLPTGASVIAIVLKGGRTKHTF